MKNTIIYATLIFTALFITGCSDKEEQHDPVDTNQPIYISMSHEDIHTRATITDYDINTFRILLFDRKGTRGLRFNFYYENMLAANKELILKIYKGDFDFVFIANEAADTRLHTVLSSLPTGTQLSSLETEYFVASSFNDTDYLPITGIARNVKIIEDNKLQVNGGSIITSTWSIRSYLKRLAVRIDMTVTTSSQWVWDNFQRFSISNLPQKVFLLEESISNAPIYNNTGVYSSARNITLSNLDSYGWNGATLAGTWKKARIIVPSNIFADKSTESKAITINAYMTGIAAVKATLGKNISGSDYTSPRNICYTFTGEVQQDGISFSVEAEAWPSAQNVDLE